MHRSLTLVFLLTATLHAADPEKIPLWPQGAPGANGSEDKDQPFLLAWPAPKETATGAAFVVCPGGGYGGLAADHEGTQVAQWLNGLGVSAYVLHYRLGTNGYHYPIQLMDVQRAVRWVRAKAPELHIDPARIGCIGGSAGGHLSGLTAMTSGITDPQEPGPHLDQSSAVQAAIVMAATQDLAAANKDKTSENAIAFFGGTHAEKPALDSKNCFICIL